MRSASCSEQGFQCGGDLSAGAVSGRLSRKLLRKLAEESDVVERLGTTAR